MKDHQWQKGDRVLVRMGRADSGHRSSTVERVGPKFITIQGCGRFRRTTLNHEHYPNRSIVAVGRGSVGLPEVEECTACGKEVPRGTLNDVLRCEDCSR